jgi:DNA-binding CsgD family transcriptional regulator
MAPDRQLYIQRQRAKDIANEDYRMSCYEKPGIVDRLSLFQRFGPDTWIAVNIYRDSTQGHVDHSECARLITIAPILTASADKHRQLVTRGAQTPINGLLEHPVAAPTMQRRLAAVCPILSTREFDVCSRILRGCSAKEIARQLGIAPTTVAEHRKNAYQARHSQPQAIVRAVFILSQVELSKSPHSRAPQLSLRA